MWRKLIALAALPLLAASVAHGQAEAPPHRLPAPAARAANSLPAGLQTAVFSGGCFWGIQGVFSHVHGVVKTVAGYTGGMAATAHYDLVSTGLTGQAESVRVTYDPKLVSYGELLRVFFSVALDPTEVNRQGPDEGSQYRSVLWVSDPAKRREAEAYVRQLDAEHVFRTAIATKVEDLHGFYPAEGYHQNFMARHPTYPYILAFDTDKVTALRTLYPSMYVSNL